MRPILFQQKIEAIELYLTGLTANEVVAKTGISKGAVVSILEDAREGKFPGIDLKDRVDELHTLSVRLKKETLDLAQARLGFAFLRRILDMGIEPDKFKEWLDFCSEISPTPPEGLIPAAIELFGVEKATGKSYGEIASEVKDLYSQREKLAREVQDLKANEIRARELRSELQKTLDQVNKLAGEKNRLEGAADSLKDFLRKKAEQLGISSDELEARLKELVSLEAEVTGKRSEKNRLEGEIESLIEHQQKLSSRMEKASVDFDRDMKSITQMRNELMRIAEMKGRYENEVADMEWAAQILPFLRYPDKVDDPEFRLASAVVGCIDKWLPTQSMGYLWDIKWNDITKHVRAKRVQLGRCS